MRAIYKYPMPIDYDPEMGAQWLHEPRLLLPTGAKIISVGIQNGQAMMWALVDRAVLLQARTIYVVATGRELDDSFENRRFIGTLIFGNGGIVLHVWE